MNISPLNRMRNIIYKGAGEMDIPPEKSTVKNDDVIMKELDKMSRINNVSFNKKIGYEIILSL